jgi:hypothetical protein
MCIFRSTPLKFGKMADYMFTFIYGLWHLEPSIHNEYCQILLHTKDQTEEKIAHKVLFGIINLQY